MSIDLDSMKLVYSREDFYNPDYKLEFVSEKYTNYSEKSVQQIINVLKKIGSIEKENGKDVAFFDLDEMKALFEKNKWISSGVLENKKSLLREYMRWYRDKGLDNWQECQVLSTINEIYFKGLSGDMIYQSEWFRSLDELQSEIDIAFDAYAGPDDHELDFCTTVIYLAWYGVDSEEAVNLKKNSVSMTADQIFLPQSERFIDINSKQMEFIRDYLQSEGYGVIRRGGEATLSSYKDSPFLLRSTRQIQLSENNVRTSLSNFSDLYEESGKVRRFKYDRIQKSGIYIKMIDYEIKNGEITTRDINVFERFLRESYANNMTKFYNQLKDFKQYKEYYFSK